MTCIIENRFLRLFYKSVSSTFAEVSKEIKSLNPAVSRCTKGLRLFTFTAMAEMLAKLWFKRSLGQVNSVLDNSKPRGEISFLGGTFSFLAFKCFFLRLFRVSVSFLLSILWA